MGQLINTINTFLDSTLLPAIPFLLLSCCNGAAHTNALGERKILGTTPSG